MPDFDFGGEFIGLNTLQSESIAYDPTLYYTKATLKIPVSCLSNKDEFSFYLSNNGGTTWEETLLNKEHAFEGSGSDVRYRIVASEGEVINLDPGDGFLYNIIVTYSTVTV